MAKQDYFQIPLMYAFRSAFDEKDSQTAIDLHKDGERVLSGRASLRRRGADEETLRQHFMIDLTALVNSINLNSVIALDGLRYVTASVLNFGLDDIGRLTSDDRAVEQIADELAATLMRFEPRLSAETLRVQKRDDDVVNHRVRFEVAGELHCRPFHIPIEFLAEIDVASGKLHLNQVRSLG